MNATIVARERSQRGPAPTSYVGPTGGPAESSESLLGDMNLGVRAGCDEARRAIADGAVKLGLHRNTQVVGADGFFAAFLKTIGGRDSVNPGQSIKAPQLGGVVDLTDKGMKGKLEVKPGGSGEVASLACTADFLKKIGSRARVHLVAPTEEGFKHIESGVGTKDGSFRFSKDAASYPPGTRILIEPRGTMLAWIKDRAGMNPNMHLPLVAPKS